MSAAPIPAATLVIFRERASGPPELLMVERARSMAFAGGMLVFPGGRIDAGDDRLADEHSGDRHDTAARIAAIRETIEEAGLPIGLEPQPTPEQLATMRDALHAGASFADALAVAGARVMLNALTPFARWLPNHATSRIFDTRFYLARLPPDAPPASVDATENVRLFWASAADVLAQCDAGHARVIFPTRRNLERLALFGSFADAQAQANAIPVRAVTPWTEDRDGEPHLCIPTDLGYPVTAEPMREAMRG